MLVFDVELLEILPDPSVPPPDVAAPPADAKKTASGLAYKVLRPGKGTAHPERRSQVTVHYTGWTTDGKMFDSSVEARAARDLRARRSDRRLDRRRAVDGRRRKDALLDSAAARLRGQAGCRAGMLVFDIELISHKR